MRAAVAGCAWHRALTPRLSPRSDELHRINGHIDEMATRYADTPSTEALEQKFDALEQELAKQVDGLQSQSAAGAGAAEPAAEAALPEGIDSMTQDEVDTWKEDRLDSAVEQANAAIEEARAAQEAARQAIADAPDNDDVKALQEQTIATAQLAIDRAEEVRRQAQEHERLLAAASATGSIGYADPALADGEQFDDEQFDDEAAGADSYADAATAAASAEEPTASEALAASADQSAEVGEAAATGAATDAATGSAASEEATASATGLAGFATGSASAREEVAELAADALRSVIEQTAVSEEVTVSEQQLAQARDLSLAERLAAEAARQRVELRRRERELREKLQRKEAEVRATYSEAMLDELRAEHKRIKAHFDRLIAESVRKLRAQETRQEAALEHEAEVKLKAEEAALHTAQAQELKEAAEQEAALAQGISAALTSDSAHAGDDSEHKLLRGNR